MQRNPLRLDAGQAWTDAMALLKAAPDLLLTVAGFFIMLPMLVLLMLHWPVVSADSSTTALQSWDNWTSANSPWLLLIALIGAFGRQTILNLILSHDRPTLAEAMQASARNYLWFYLTALAVSLIQSGGFFLFVLPGCYLMGRLFVAETVFVGEGIVNPLKAMARSIELTRGNGWRIFAVMAIIAAGAFIFMLAVSSVVGVMSALIGGAGLALFLAAFVVSSVFTGVYLILLLVSVAAWRQLAQKGNVRRSFSR